MTTHILILNAGSSSLKFALFEADGEDLTAQARGNIEALETSPHLTLRAGTGEKLEDNSSRKTAPTRTRQRCNISSQPSKRISRRRKSRR